MLVSIYTTLICDRQCQLRFRKGQCLNETELLQMCCLGVAAWTLLPSQSDRLDCFTMMKYIYLMKDYLDNMNATHKTEMFVSIMHVQHSNVRFAGDNTMHIVQYVIYTISTPASRFSYVKGTKPYTLIYWNDLLWMSVWTDVLDFGFCTIWSICRATRERAKHNTSI